VSTLLLTNAFAAHDLKLREQAQPHPVAAAARALPLARQQRPRPPGGTLAPGAWPRPRRGTARWIRLLRTAQHPQGLIRCRPAPVARPRGMTP